MMEMTKTKRKIISKIKNTLDNNPVKSLKILTSFKIQRKRRKSQIMNVIDCTDIIVEGGQDPDFEGEHINKQQQDFILQRLQKRRRYYYTTGDLFYGILCCFKFKNRLCRKVHTNHRLYKKGIERYKLDIDVVNLISILHQSRIMMNALASERQMNLAKFSHYRSIS